jgi:hypothetical protein
VLAVLNGNSSGGGKILTIAGTHTIRNLTVENTPGTGSIDLPVWTKIPVIG